MPWGTDVEGAEARAVFTSKNRLVVVVGPTAAGKSACALGLCRHVRTAYKLEPHLINCDALQILDGLPIATNKPTAAERREVTHHCIGALPGDGPSGDAALPTVARFVAAVVPLVNGLLHDERNFVVICGGTNYYAQALLLVSSSLGQPPATEELHGPGVASVAAGTQSWEELHRMDPDEAAKWHPRDTRRIENAIRRVRSRLLQQHDDDGGRRTPPGVTAAGERADSGTPPEWSLRQWLVAPPDRSESGGLLLVPLVLIVDWSDKEKLNERINDRVTSMVASGLLVEVATRVAQLVIAAVRGQVAAGCSAQQLEGAWRDALAVMESGAAVRGVESAIGFKEIARVLWPHAWRAAVETRDLNDATLVSSEALRHTGRGDLDAAVDTVRLATRTYARRQRLWLRNRFERLVGALLPAERMWRLEGSAGSSAVAAELFDGIVRGAPPSDTAVCCRVTHADNTATRMDASNVRGSVPDGHAKMQTCGTCGVTTPSGPQWELHLASRRHARMTDRAKRPPGLTDREWHERRRTQRDGGGA